MSSTFYFLTYVGKDRQEVTVIDLGYNVDYERDEFAAVNDLNFENHLEAIIYARALAIQNGLKYRLFESRYNSSLDEKLILRLR